MVLPRPKEINCFLCKYYQPDDFQEFVGYCTRYAPKAGSGAGTLGPPPNGIAALINRPEETWCGDFAKWLGEPRDQGFCPAPTVTVLAADGPQEVADETAARVAAANATTPETETKTTTKAAAKSKGGK